MIVAILGPIRLHPYLPDIDIRSDMEYGPFLAMLDMLRPDTHRLWPFAAGVHTMTG